MPIGIDGWMVNPEYTFSRSDPKPENGGLDNIGRFERFSLRSWYPLIRTRSETLTLSGELEHIHQSIALPLFDTDLNEDRYTVLRIGAAFEAGLPWGAGLQTSATFSQGLSGRNQADADASGIPLSRQGADPGFGKLSVDASVSLPLPYAFRFDMIGRSQLAFGEPLLTPEQFFLDGGQAISAYPSGALAVDEGGTLRCELSRAFVMPGSALHLILSPYGFGAIGAGRLNDPTVDEIAEIHAGAVGAGIRFGGDRPGGYQAAALGLEVARQFSNVPEQDDWRGSLNLSVRF